MTRPPTEAAYSFAALAMEAASCCLASRVQTCAISTRAVRESAFIEMVRAISKHSECHKNHRKITAMNRMINKDKFETVSGADGGHVRRSIRRTRRSCSPPYYLPY
jgi:hypothetical protein